MNRCNHIGRITSSAGYVLLFVLILLNVMVMMSWYSLEAALSMRKMNYAAWQKEKAYYQAQALLFSLEHMIIEELPACLIPITSPHELLRREVSWWQNRACNGNLDGDSYYYVVEHLVDDACAILNKGVDEKIESAAYYRLTLFFSLKNNFFKSKIVLQSTVIRPSAVDGVCADSQRPVLVGRQMWRELK